MREINKIIIHCSATPNDRDVSADQINHWHKQRGWSGIGYHYVIRRRGTVEAGRPVKTIGAHCLGQNRASIGICLIGNDKFSTDQYDSLKFLIKRLSSIYSLSTADIYGHYEFTDKKTCPNIDMSLLRMFL